MRSTKVSMAQYGMTAWWHDREGFWVLQYSRLWGCVKLTGPCETKTFFCSVINKDLLHRFTCLWLDGRTEGTTHPRKRKDLHLTRIQTPLIAYLWLHNHPYHSIHLRWLPPKIVKEIFGSEFAEPTRKLMLDYRFFFYPLASPKFLYCDVRSIALSDDRLAHVAPACDTLWREAARSPTVRWLHNLTFFRFYQMKNCLFLFSVLCSFLSLPADVKQRRWRGRGVRTQNLMRT